MNNQIDIFEQVKIYFNEWNCFSASLINYNNKLFNRDIETNETNA